MGLDLASILLHTRQGSANTETDWANIAQDILVGQQIVAVRYLSKAETRAMGWKKRPLALVLHDGTTIFAAGPDEKDAGALLGQTHDGEPMTFPVMK